MIKRLLSRIFLSVILVINGVIAFGQEQAAGTSAIDNTMRSNGKIYVVMAVCLVILVIFLLYLIRIDAKITKKEKMN